MQCPIEKWYSQLSSYNADQSDIKNSIPWPKGSQFSGPFLQEKYRLISQVAFYFLWRFLLLLGICHLMLVVLVLSEALWFFFSPPFSCFLGDGGGVGLSFSYCKHSAVADMAPASPLKIELFIEVSVACKIFGIAWPRHYKLWDGQSHHKKN